VSGGGGDADASGPDAATGQGAGDVEVPFGWWPSPLSAAEAAAGKLGRSGLQAAGGSVLWTESRPSEGGRPVVVRADRSGTGPAKLVDVSPAGVGVRSRVHEYGGGEATVSGGTLYYVDQADQRWYRVPVDPEGPPPPHRPVALSPEEDRAPAPAPEASVATRVRYADGRTTRSGGWLVSVEERSGPAGTAHRLVALATDGTLRLAGLVDGSDFVAAPRPSPDGRWLVWVAWDHPSMPWDSSELMIAPLDEDGGLPRLGTPRRLAGGGGRSVGQPHWCRDGSLVFIDDRSGWWLPYRLAPQDLAGDGGGAVPLARPGAEYHAPDWGLGQSTLAELPDGSLLARVHRDGRDHLVRLVPPGAGSGPGWEERPVDQPCVTIAGVAVLGDGADAHPAGDPGVGVVLGSTPGQAQAVFEVPLAETSAGRPAGPRQLSAVSGRVPDGTRLSRAVPFVATGDAGPVPGLFFAPVCPGVRGPAGQRPPVVVFCHGGPTAAADPGYHPVVQFFTAHGLAVAAVDYRGSTGYGTAYRRQLDGRWGVADVDDCVAFATGLAAAGLVDPDRMAIRGTSAGGLTALGALVRSDRFAGAASWYGVTDLEALAADTHDFESRYLDTLVGPWPADAEVYRARSPLHHADRVTGAVLLLQGEDDPVVPPDQSERFADQLTEAGVRCRLVVFPGESHGFRAAATIEASLEAELDFYRSVLGAPVGADDPVAGF
jgi:dipeptidyl aminopeptidase/acylaminoacyl peptidase